jgi:hypothetical protein
MKTYLVREVKLYALLIEALNGGELLSFRLRTLYASSALNRRMGGPRALWSTMIKRKIFVTAENQTQVNQHVTTC